MNVKLLYSQEMKWIDQTAMKDYGIPGIVLMENAGLRVVECAEWVLENLEDPRVVVLAGKGNNGGDGLVIARHLMNAGMKVETFLTAEPEELPADAYTNYQILKKMGSGPLPLREAEDLNRLTLSLMTADLLIDALYGIGFQGQLDEFDAGIARLVNWSRATVIAVDIPSGVEADSGCVHGEAIMADYTVTFALPKVGLVLEPGKDYAGTLSVADISIPPALLNHQQLKNNLITSQAIKAFFTPRDPESHKGSYGHVLVIGGSPGMSGAAEMTAYAALRSGAGLVTSAVPESLLSIMESMHMEIMHSPLLESYAGTISLDALPAIGNLLGACSVCAIGPGMSQYTEARAVLHFVLERAGIPVVIDADGINALQGDASILKDRQVPVVLTPHPGEMARLTGKSIAEVQANRIELAREFASDYGVVLVLKGNKTVVATPQGEVFINISGNPGMATAGSGDVLTGILCGFIAQGMRVQDAAVAAVYIHGMAGDQVAADKGQRGMTAGDLIEELPELIYKLE